MGTLSRRHANPVNDMLSWLEFEPLDVLRGIGLTPYLRVEDFVQDGSYVIRAEMPGIDPEKDLEITVDGDVLTIHGERHAEEIDRNRHELHYGAFSRSVRLPRSADVSDVTAAYVDGVLTLRVPFDGEEIPHRTIPVSRGDA